MNPNRIVFHAVSKDTQKLVNNFLEAWNSESDSIICQTSGSTGKPKEISITKEKMKRSAAITRNYFGLNKNSIGLLCLSMHSIAGKMMLVRALEIGFKLIITEPSSNPLKDLDLPISFVAMVPMQVYSCIDQDLEKLMNIKHILIGGGEISAELEAKLRNHKLSAFHSFGMTETVSHIAMRDILKTKENIFEALDSTSFTSENNQLIILSDLTDQQKLKTNDLVEIIDNKHFKWLGRKDNVINTGGIKIPIENIERKLSSEIKSPFFLIGEKDNKLGESIALCIESNSEIKNIQQIIKTCLDSYERPKKIYYCTKFLRTPLEKIKRKESYEKCKSGCL
jgi:o-succinylbenzoate---CoA ligase